MPEKTYNLQEIIISVLKEKGRIPEDSNKSIGASHESEIRALRRDFERLLDKLGGDVKALKGRDRTIRFNEKEFSFMKIILKQLYEDSGLVAQFVNENENKSGIASKDIHELIQSLLDEADKNGANEEELHDMAFFFDGIFSCSLLRAIESCYASINMLVLNIQDLPSNQQTAYMVMIEQILKREVARLITESTVRTLSTAVSITESPQFVNGIEQFMLIRGDDQKNFFKPDPEILSMFIQRDSVILQKIQDDDDLRYYIEKKFGKKAEEIFCYAYLDQQ